MTNEVLPGSAGARLEDEHARAFARIVGDDHVLADDATRAKVETATFASNARVPFVVRPGNLEELTAVVKLANERRVPIYPVSAGVNWGYGSSVPTRSGSVVVSLARMNRILELDEDLGTVTVEPGVTFAQLHAFLVEKGSGLFLNVGGMPPWASVVGNAVERGLGKGPSGDRFAASCDLQIVLGDGEVLETGFARFAGAKAARVSKYSVGPYLDGLFTQSNFGIVTRMTLWLAPKPAVFQTFFYHVHKEGSRIGGLAEALRDLRLHGTVRTPVLVANDYRHLSFVLQYPFTQAGGRTPLPVNLLPGLRERIRRGLWSGDGALYSATPEQAAADRAVVERALAPHVDEIDFWDVETARVREAGARAMDEKNGTAIAKMVELAYSKSLYIGTPMPRSSTMGYWRKKNPAPADLDLDRDRCGVLWVSPVVPARARDVHRIIAILEEVAGRYGFEPNIGMNLVNERAFDVTASLLYDREEEGHDALAMRWHDDLMTKLNEEGYLPYRLGIESMQSMPPAGASYERVFGALKQAFDPNGILAPGRYEPRRRDS